MPSRCWRLWCSGQAVAGLQRGRRGVPNTPHERRRATAGSRSAVVVAALSCCGATCSPSFCRTFVLGRKHQVGEAQLEVVISSQHSRELPRGISAAHGACASTPGACTSSTHAATPGVAERSAISSAGAGAGGDNAHLEECVAEYRQGSAGVARAPLCGASAAAGGTTRGRWREQCARCQCSLPSPSARSL